MPLLLIRVMTIFCLLYLAESNLNLKSMTFTDLMLNSARYGFGAICFLFGFLVVARVIREHVESFLAFGIKNKAHLITFCIEGSLLIGVYWVLFQNNKWLSLASLVMAFIYGGLSANIRAAREVKRFQRSNET
ncbi:MULTISPECIES: hypothetical protein [Bacillaceae]|uniref:hypothetical protein n=1 Tax=Bacillales TaxID=1385 RepID=UPI001A7E97A5|nr:MULTISPECIES: hypothetical protein [Bacillaceae]MDO6655347.1 hypothetical protein [Anaerobacillus sp. 1_MG-2023]